MKASSIDLADVQIIPAEGSFLTQDGVVTFQLNSSDLDASKSIALEGSLDGVNFGAITDSAGDAITMTLANDTTLIKSYTVDKRLNLRLSCATGTGVITYSIAEG